MSTHSFAATKNFDVVADIEKDATYVYDFNLKQFRKNPYKSSEKSTSDETQAKDIACATAKKIGDQVWMTHWEKNQNSIICKGTKCCPTP